ncbi:hypothetical protein L6164_022466 [Bauhinia variegata]|uniref:Uncharacterized protein n=1 Tax=Bauhinia variegata TaxID=167791 RepID=A0ACB9MFR3_BAUVA|nr:hypothetical protein L6164_022466 [Bauhinia variegata]
MSSIISRAPSSNHSIGDSLPPEESGWTTYLEDLFNNSNKGCSISSGVANSSMLSDAASSAAKKLYDREQGDEFPPVHKNIRTSSFKKRKKTKAAALFDDALEDTASSPVNSPKENGSTSGQYEREELGSNGRDSDCTELKKRGLCLVPLSMVVKYLG